MNLKILEYSTIMAWKKPEWNGQVLIDLREADGWTQKGLAQQIAGLVGKSVSAPTMHNWENGTEPPSYAHISALARTLKVSVARFFGSRAGE